MFAATGRIVKHDGGMLEVKWWPEDDCLVHLPLYNGMFPTDFDGTVEGLQPNGEQHKVGINLGNVF